MCNRFKNKIEASRYPAEFSQLKLPFKWAEPGRIPNLEPREVRPTDPAPVIRSDGEGVRFGEMRWGFAPGRPKAPPVINFRSEGRRFDKGRCLIPVSEFYEFTGTKYPKTRWAFRMSGHDWFCFAGLWRPAEGEWPASFTLLTTEPGPDVKPYHDRQPVVLAREAWAQWLNGPEPESLLQSSPAGSLEVEKAA